MTCFGSSVDTIGFKMHVGLISVSWQAKDKGPMILINLSRSYSCSCYKINLTDQNGLPVP
jgi:hypothetical protein